MSAGRKCDESFSTNQRRNEWSGRWDSNPRLDLGKVPYYPYTTTAPNQGNFITSSARRQDRIVLAETDWRAHAVTRCTIVDRAKLRPVWFS
jgi:hypothetical protein